MTLKAALVASIVEHGPMPLSTYMALCNQHYYAAQNPFGAKGDFITAPDISQIFGELIGLWCADLWLRAGAPNPFQLIELGPGRGTLMADVLRATKTVPGFVQAVQVHMVETSASLRALQAQAVPQAQWHNAFDAVPDGLPCIIIANEFFDALPIEQWVKGESAWMMRCVGSEEERLILTLSTCGRGMSRPSRDREKGVPSREICPVAHPSPDPAGHPLRQGERGDIYETSPASQAFANSMAARLATHGGACLVIDYGHMEPAMGDTLQAVSRHAYADILSDPGTVDLTAHVDFAALFADVALTRHGPITQGSFLRRLGIDARTAMLCRANPDNAENLIAATARLTEPNQMGQMFKVMAVVSRDWPTPAGFGETDCD